MSPGKIIVALVALLLLGFVAWHGLKQRRESAENDASPIRKSSARISGLRTNSIGSPPDVNPKVARAPTITRFANFDLEGGQRVELQVPPEIYHELKEGQRGELSFQGTRFLEFKPEPAKPPTP